LKELAALHSEDCIAVLVKLRDHAESEQVRLAAASALLDRGHGRPRQEVDVNDEEHVTIIVRGSTPRPVLEVRPALEPHATDEAETVEES